MAIKNRILWLIIMGLLAFGAILTALLVILLPDSENFQSLWFVRKMDKQSGDLFGQEKRIITPTPDSRLSYLLLTNLIAGPQSSELVTPFPSGTKVLSYRQEGQTVYIDFSADYGKADPFTLSLAEYCLAATLTGVVDEKENGNMDKILYFHITIGGNPHPYYSNTFSLSDFLTDGFGLIPFTRTATLYYPHPNNLYLVPRQEQLMLYSENDLLTSALDTLLHGPADVPSLAIVPPDTTVLFAGVADGVITVNLSRAFLDYANAGMSQARMMLYSIVNTLTGLVSADSVRFLIEGEVISSYGGIPLLEPLSRDASLIFGA